MVIAIYYVGDIDDSSVKSTNHGKTFDLVMNDGSIQKARVSYQHG